MTRQTKSRWRRRAHEVILDVLASLPVTASLKDRRKACNERYPFGERRHEPYKAWLKELKAMVGPARPEQIKSVNIVNVSPTHVECDWCDGGKLWWFENTVDRWDRRCLMCATTRDRWEDDKVTDWQGWARWLKVLAEAPDDTVARLVFADWLEEISWPAQAALERAKVLGWDRT